MTKLALLYALGIHLGTASLGTLDNGLFLNLLVGLGVAILSVGLTIFCHPEVAVLVT